MKNFLIELYQSVKKNIRRLSTFEIVMIAVMVFVVADDLAHRYAMHQFENTSQYKEYQKIKGYIADKENNDSIDSVSVSAFLTEVKPGSSIYFTNASDGTAIVSIDKEKISVVKTLPSVLTVSAVESKLMDKNITYEWLLPQSAPKSMIQKIFSPNFLLVLFYGGLAYLMLVMSGINPFSKEFSALYPEEIEGSLDDLIGYEDIKQESKQLRNIISKNTLYAEYGIEGTFNILFSGKAGTGKSKFAQYLAKELDIPLVATTGSLDEIYVGSGAKKIRKIFKNAQKAAATSEHKAAIVFIDEAQKMLRKRGVGREEKWADDTANELLAHLDGVQSNPKYNIIVIMASNFDESSFEMDEAMLRRFRKKIHFRDPNLQERKAILFHYLKDISQKEEDIDIDRVAKHMSGMTPAIIESMVNEAALLALREKKKIDSSLLMQAIERLLVGKSNRETTKDREKIREIVSVHEMGHFLIDWHRGMQAFNADLNRVKAQSRVVKVSSESISNLGALGFVLNENSDEILLQSIEEMEWEIKQLYGGLAAEKVVFGKRGSTTGSANDIQKATKLLKHLVVENSVYGEAKLNHSELMMSDKLVTEMEEHSAIFYTESCKIIEEHKELLCHLSQKLMEEWSFDKERLFDLIENYRTVQFELEDARAHGFGILKEEVA
jgi:cell division protease FtsH